MKRSEIFFDSILLPLDFLAIVVASIGVYAVRVSPQVRAFRPVLFEVDLPLREFLILVLIVAGVTLGIFSLLGLYTMQVTRRAIDEFTRILAGVTLSAMGIILWMFLRAEIFESRFILVGAWVAAIVLITLQRYILRAIQIRLLERGIGVHRVVLVGESEVGDHVSKQLSVHARIGYEVVGRLTRVSRDDLEDILRRDGIDEVVQCDPALPEADNLTLLDFCDEQKIDYKYVPNLYSTLVSNVRTKTLAGYPIVELRRTPLDGWGRVVKRTIDLIGAGGGLIILSPMFALVAFGIAWTSPGSIFFRQRRIGRNQQPFEILKFRTMIKDAEQKKKELLKFNERSGPLFKMRNDPRVTPLGRFLRRARIDELPQLWNVLRNEMSLIGPRPHLPQEISQYRTEHRKLFTIKPGMTGLAQVSGSSNLSFDSEATLDIQYIEQWSLKTDLQILLKTIWHVIWDRSAV